MKRRLDIWKEGKLTELFIEGETIQKRLSEIKSVETICRIIQKNLKTIRRKVMSMQH